jgi:hypothetical protein
VIIADNFQNYDYGIVDNYKQYKQEMPPSYNFNKITAPITLFYSTNDIIATKQVIKIFSVSIFKYNNIVNKFNICF